MRLAIVAVPPLALVSIATLGLGLMARPHRAPPPPPSPIQARFVAIDVVLTEPTPACESAHALMVRGRVTGGASHVQLAGPIIYTDVTTNARGDFELRMPVDGNVCELLPSPQHFAFEGDGMTVSYTIGFDR